MSYYDPQGWQAPQRQASWEQPAPPSRSGASSTSQRDDNPTAFTSQFEEVDRAIDNLVKSGKLYPGSGSRGNSHMGMSSRHPYDHDSRQVGHVGRHSYGGEYDPSRSHSASNLQNYYASQRQSGRGDADQMQQAKRRMAAQRERELRNYHQEQQYNRSVLAEMSSNNSNRSLSPSTMSEEGRRELLARQHRALYGNESNNFMPQSGYSDDGQRLDQNSGNQSAVASGMRGNSPRGIDPFGSAQGPSASNTNDQSAQGAPQGNQESSRSEAIASPPIGMQPPTFGNFDAVNQSSNNSPSPADAESPARQIQKATTAPIGSGMGPIGSRPSTQQAPNPALSKRSTTPLASPLSFGLGPNDQSSNERAGSSNSNDNQQKQQQASASNMGAWGTGSGVWGSNKIGATSVWG